MSKHFSSTIQRLMLILIKYPKADPTLGESGNLVTTAQINFATAISTSSTFKPVDTLTPPQNQATVSNPNSIPNKKTEPQSLFGSSSGHSNDVPKSIADAVPVTAPKMNTPGDVDFDMEVDSGESVHTGIIIIHCPLFSYTQLNSRNHFRF